MAAFSLERQLHRTLRLQAALAQAQLQGLSHADSLLQPADGGNRLNWHMGHLVWNRAQMLETAGLPLPFDAALYVRYQRDAPPLKQADAALPLDAMQAHFAACLPPLLDWLATAPPAALDAPAPNDSRSVLERVAFLVWHETIHIGQLEQYRRLAGYTEKVV